MTHTLSRCKYSRNSSLAHNTTADLYPAGISIIRITRLNFRLKSINRKCLIKRSNITLSAIAVSIEHTSSLELFPSCDVDEMNSSQRIRSSMYDVVWPPTPRYFFASDSALSADISTDSRERNMPNIGAATNSTARRSTEQ